MTSLNLPAALLAVVVTAGTVAAMFRIANHKHHEVLAASPHAQRLARAPSAPLAVAADRQTRGARSSCTEPASCRPPG